MTVLAAVAYTCYDRVIEKVSLILDHKSANILVLFCLLAAHKDHLGRRSVTAV